MAYDSTKDADIHRENVRHVWEMVRMIMEEKIQVHDNSKYMSPERECYDKYIPMLRETKYGTAEYYEVRKKMAEEGLNYHYSANRHHPEHFANGIEGMDLFDFLEHVIDCYAASMVSDISYKDGIDSNANRFGYPPELVSILKNTAKRLDFIIKK